MRERRDDPMSAAVAAGPPGVRARRGRRRAPPTRGGTYRPARAVDQRRDVPPGT
ncbi:hypothetical protein ABZ192_05315 [Streptomyces sp. NPDC006235]|uniref:hypothetical protein n=1 Tax=Streptomyces sp. NPDC006235 TaxID=3156736 RepID=UPI0033A99435